MNKEAKYVSSRRDSMAMPGSSPRILHNVIIANRTQPVNKTKQAQGKQTYLGLFYSVYFHRRGRREIETFGVERRCNAVITPTYHSERSAASPQEGFAYRGGGTPFLHRAVWSRTYGLSKPM